MMRGVIALSLGFRFIVVVVAALVVFAGVRQASSLPLDALPEFAPPFVEVQIEALGLNTSEVESLVTLNLEEMLTGVSWVDKIRSKSVPGMASVTLYFEPGTNLINARQLVQERLLLAHLLPNVSKPPVILQPLSATSRVMMVGLSSKTLSPVELGVLARWKIRPALMGATGVANVVMWGHRERQLQVLVDPERLSALGLSLDQIVETAGNAFWVSPLSWLKAATPGSGGWIDGPQQRLEVRHVLPISAPADLGKVTIERQVGLTLGDAAQVVESYPPIIGDALLPSGSGVLLVVEKFPGSNTLEVTRAVEATIKTLQPGLTGVDIDASVFRPASFMESALSNLSRTALVAAILLILAFFVFLRNWRVAVIGLVAIPLSLIAALFILGLRGATGNVMVLVGLVIALGVIIDDAVSDVRSIGNRLAQRRTEGGDTSSMATVIAAASEVRGPLVFATLIVLASALPFLFFEGVNGAILRPLVLTYGLAVLASLLVALTVTPVLSFLLLGNASETGEAPVVRWLQPRYERALGWAIRMPALNVAAVVVGLAGLVAFPILAQSPLVPPFKEPQLIVQWDGAPGTSHPAMLRITEEARRELQSIPGVRSVSAHVGRAILGDQVVGINSAELWVSINPGSNYDATIAAVANTLDGYPGLTHITQTYSQQAIKRVLTGSADDVVVRVYGAELPILRTKAEEVRQAISRIPGVVDLQVEAQVEEPHISIRVDLSKAEVYGLKPGDVRRAAATLVNGLEVGSMFEGQKVFEVVVWGLPGVRANLSSIRDLLIDTPRGGHVRVGEVADIRVLPQLNTINRDSVSRRVDVSFNTRGRDVGAVATDVQQAIGRIQFPLEYHADVLGEYTERAATQQRLVVVGLVVAIGIYLLLQAAFQSWGLALLTILVLPWALAGGLLAAGLLSGGSLSLAALLGLLTVLGIAARNAIVTIRHYQRLEEEGGSPGAALVVRGARERLGPILLTAVATALALLPFVVFGDIPGQEVARPLAIVIMSGLVTATLLNLFVLPAIYLRFRGSARPATGVLAVGGGA